MRACLFCGGGPDSKEHAIPEWVSRVCGCSAEGKFPIVTLHYREGVGIRDKRGFHLDRLRVGCVCRSCNNGWMSRLEEAVKPILQPLLEGGLPVLRDLLLERLVIGSPVVSLWTVKTAMTLTMALPGGLRIPINYAEQVASGVVPNDVLVFAAFSRIPDIGVAFSRHFQAFNGGVGPAVVSADKVRGFDFALQLNHLLLRLVRAPEADVGFAATSNYTIPVQLWPVTRERVTGECCFEDLSHFRASMYLNTSEGHRPRSGKEH